MPPKPSFLHRKALLRVPGVRDNFFCIFFSSFVFNLETRSLRELVAVFVNHTKIKPPPKPRMVPYSLKSGEGWKYRYGIPFMIKAGELHPGGPANTPGPAK